ncbi:hypothetical protein AMS68_001465 [Peltaster fructicola]|uniref:Zn(2)-C6 fungal-type domain-containing protein n=1 Tax=Peltaster fructicola TaxID=286661 RepID=A0A6H0XMV0_9PEZI|nr:hypothetical protein AMS68_001465 [Peltaster fructicola]
MSEATNKAAYSGTSQYSNEYGIAIGNSPDINAILNSGTTGLDLTSNPTYLDYDTVYQPSPTTTLSANAPGSSLNGVQRITTPASERHHSIGARSDVASPILSRPSKESADNDETTQEQASGERSEGTHAPPPWTELKTKAGKDRKRLPLACIACRRKKIRCSGEHPACKHCLRSRIPCVYKVTTRKAAPRTDYMAMLDKRLKRMEERVIRIIPKEEQGIVNTTGRATVKPTPPAAAPRRTSMSKKRAAEQTLDDLELWSKTEISAPRTAPAIDPSKAHELDEQSLLLEGLDKLPSKELQEHLAEVFFDFVYGQSYHLLHKPSFMRRLAQGEIAPVLLLAVCAMAARFSDHPAVRTEPAFLRGEEWASAAREISLKRYDSPNITILIVYLILTLHEFGTCQGGRSWMFAGMAHRMAYAMQLHHDLAYDPRTQHSMPRKEYSHTDREIRRRTMWACFMTDRYCSSGTERPTFISMEHLKLQLPIRENYFQMELAGPTEDLAGEILAQVGPAGDQLSDVQDNMGVAAYMIRIVAIWGDCINYFNLGGKAKEQHPMWDSRSRFDHLRKNIRAWQEKLPDRLHYRADNLAAHASEKIANQFIFMHIIYHQTSLFVNRFALPLVTARSALVEGIPNHFIQDAARAAVEAANTISLLVSDGMNYNVVAPFAGYSAFCSSTVHIQGAFSKNAALLASSNKHLTRNINYLTKMKKHWGMFGFMTENLRDLYRKHVDAARHLAQGGSDKSNDPIFQYGDWFDRYPHGVSGADYDGPQASVKKEPGADAGMSQQSDLQTVEEFFSNPSPAAQPTVRGQKTKKARRSAASDSKNDSERASVTQQQPNGAGSNQTQHMGDLYSQLGVDVNTSYAHTFDQGYPTQLDQACLDRQTALAAYTGFDPDTAIAFAAPGAPFDPLGANMNFNPASMSDFASGQAAYQAAASGGWFMPLNMDASSLIEGSGPYNPGSIDWSTQFDMSSLQGPALTPRTQMDLDAQQNGNGLG